METYKNKKPVELLWNVLDISRVGEKMSFNENAF